jgi:hypothetical protein
MGAVGALLISALFLKTKKSNSLGQQAKTMMSSSNDSTQSEKSVFDNWSIRLALVGIGLGIFSAFARGYTQIGFMIGFAIPMSLIGLVIGFVIDLFIKPARATAAPINAAVVEALPLAQPESKAVQAFRESPKFVEPIRKEFKEQLAPSMVKVASAGVTTSPEQKTKTDTSVQPPIARWYKSDYGIGEKRSDLYFMHFEIQRLESPEAGYKILHPHPRKEGQVVPRFVSDTEIEKPVIRGRTVSSACPDCRTTCSSPLEQTMYFKCADCQTTWWQKR